jgi:hypothetical protein
VTAVDDGPELADLMDIAEPESFVTAAYRRALGRDPDSAGPEPPRGATSRRSAARRDASGPRLVGRSEGPGIAFTWHGKPLGVGRQGGMFARLRPGSSHRRLEADLERLWRADRGSNSRCSRFAAGSNSSNRWFRTCRRPHPR